MGKKKIVEKVDGGLTPKQVQQLRSAIRKVWHWSHARKLCLKRATRPDGFGECEQCFSIVPKLTVDHIRSCGDVDEGYLKRMFVPSSELMALCPKCHNAKTRQERRNGAV